MIIHLAGPIDLGKATLVKGAVGVAKKRKSRTARRLDVDVQQGL